MLIVSTKVRKCCRTILHSQLLEIDVAENVNKFNLIVKSEQNITLS